ncbi:Uncharacterised protein [Chlamydia trachomatis]|nr:Uncharacterised protein [Chlamydia trachomatis]
MKGLPIGPERLAPGLRKVRILGKDVLDRVLPLPDRLLATVVLEGKKQVGRSLEVVQVAARQPVGELLIAGEPAWRLRARGNERRYSPRSPSGR